jgi:hypothetical protein
VNNLNLLPKKKPAINMHLNLLHFTLLIFLAPEIVVILKIVQRVTHSNVMSLKFRDIVFKRIDISIKKELVAQLITR